MNDLTIASSVSDIERKRIYAMVQENVFRWQKSSLTKLT